MDADPLEGPSWLFASVKKKKRRSSAVKKLSCIMSDLDNTDTNTSALDSSDIDPSGQFVLDRDLRQSINQPIVTPDILVEDGDSNQENVPINEDIPNVSNITATRDLQTPRTPLSSLGTCLDEGGNQINLKEARIMLNNVGVDGQNSPRNVITPSPVLISRKKTLTLDELFSFGVREDLTPKLKRKYGSDSQVGEVQPKLKKARNTEVPQSSNVRLQNLEVRLEKNICQTDKPEEDHPPVVEAGGRSRRQKSSVSYKEPSLGKKMRQVFTISVNNFSFQSR